MSGMNKGFGEGQSGYPHTSLITMTWVEYYTIQSHLNMIIFPPGNWQYVNEVYIKGQRGPWVSLHANWREDPAEQTTHPPSRRASGILNSHPTLVSTGFVPGQSGYPHTSLITMTWVEYYTIQSHLNMIIFPPGNWQYVNEVYIKGQRGPWVSLHANWREDPAEQTAVSFWIPLARRSSFWFSSWKNKFPLIL